MPTAIHHNSHVHQYKCSDDLPHVSYGSVDIRLSPLPLHDVNNKDAHSSLLTGAYQLLLRTLACIAFLVANAVFAACASLLLLALLSCTLLLVPLCFVGVLVLQLTFRLGVLKMLAQADVALVNVVSTRSSQIQLEASAIDELVPLHPLLRDDRAAVTVASGLHEVTVTSFMTLLYFAAIKVVLALLGLFVVAAVVWSPAALLRLVFASSGSTVWGDICSALLLALVFAVAVGSLDVVTHLSCASTRLFCCEQTRDSTSIQSTSAPCTFASSKIVVVYMDDLGRLKQVGGSPSAIA